jgi:hypothetical protein
VSDIRSRRLQCKAMQSAMPQISAGGEKSSLLRSNSGAKPARAHPPSPCQDIFAVWGQARSKSRPLSCAIGSAPASAVPYFMVSQETTSGAPAGHGIAPRSQLRAFFRVPEGKVLISAELVEVKIERTEELIRSPASPLSKG